MRKHDEREAALECVRLANSITDSDGYHGSPEQVVARASGYLDFVLGMDPKVPTAPQPASPDSAA